MGVDDPLPTPARRRRRRGRRAGTRLGLRCRRPQRVHGSRTAPDPGRASCERRPGRAPPRGRRDTRHARTGSVRRRRHRDTCPVRRQLVDPSQGGGAKKRPATRSAKALALTAKVSPRRCAPASRARRIPPFPSPCCSPSRPQRSRPGRRSSRSGGDAGSRVCDAANERVGRRGGRHPAGRGALAITGWPQQALAACALLIAPGLAVLALLPRELRRLPVAVPVVPIAGFVVTTILLVSLSAVGLALDDVTIRAGLGAVVLAGRIASRFVDEAARRAPPRRVPRPARHAGITGLGVALQALVIGRPPSRRGLGRVPALRPGRSSAAGAPDRQPVLDARRRLVPARPRRPRRLRRVPDAGGRPGDGAPPRHLGLRRARDPRGLRPRRGALGRHGRPRRRGHLRRRTDDAQHARVARAAERRGAVADPGGAVRGRRRTPRRRDAPSRGRARMRPRRARRGTPLQLRPRPARGRGVVGVRPRAQARGRSPGSPGGRSSPRPSQGRRSRSTSSGATPRSGGRRGTRRSSRRRSTGSSSPAT